MWIKTIDGYILVKRVGVIGRLLLLQGLFMSSKHETRIGRKSLEYT